MSFLQSIHEAIRRDGVDKYDALAAIWAITTVCEELSRVDALRAFTALEECAADPTFVRWFIKSDSYADFLDSSYWHMIREAVIEVRGARCELCASERSIQVHHKTYEHHFQEHLHLQDLIILCDECHAKFHDKLPKAVAAGGVA
jgi:hypothetical protein